MARFKHRPMGSNWGDFGPDDQRGRLNLLTPQLRRTGLTHAIEGITFTLSLPLDYPGGSAMMPYRRPPHFHVVEREGRPNYNFPLTALSGAFTDIVCDDAVTLYTQYSTQWDSLAHIGGLFDADATLGQHERFDAVRLQRIVRALADSAADHRPAALRHLDKALVVAARAAVAVTDRSGGDTPLGDLQNYECLAARQVVADGHTVGRSDGDAGWVHTWPPR